MAYIKKLKDNELIGGTDNTDMYPVTSTEAVYNKENVSQEYINNHVDGSKIVDGTIVNSKIANGAVSMNKLDNVVQTEIQKGAQKAWNPRGAYNENTVYGVNDLVYYTDTNSSYISLQANNQGHNPAWQSATGGWWMKIVDGSYANVVEEELQQLVDSISDGTQQQVEELNEALEALEAQADQSRQDIQNIVNNLAVVQTTGQSTSDVMSQKAVTDSLVGSVISYDNSQSGLASNNVQGALDDLAARERYSQEEMDYSSVVTTSRKWINNGVWQSMTPAVVILIPKRLFENADRIKVVGVTNTRMMFLKSNESSIGSNASYCDGTRVMSIGANTRFYDIPSDCNYIYFDYSYNGVSRMPTSIQIIQSIRNAVISHNERLNLITSDIDAVTDAVVSKPTILSFGSMTQGAGMVSPSTKQWRALDNTYQHYWFARSLFMKKISIQGNGNVASFITFVKTYNYTGTPTGTPDYCEGYNGPTRFAPSSLPQDTIKIPDDCNYIIINKGFDTTVQLPAAVYVCHELKGVVVYKDTTVSTFNIPMEVGFLSSVNGGNSSYSRDANVNNGYAYVSTDGKFNQWRNVGMIEVSDGNYILSFDKGDSCIINYYNGLRELIKRNLVGIENGSASFNIDGAKYIRIEVYTKSETYEQDNTHEPMYEPNVSISGIFPDGLNIRKLKKQLIQEADNIVTPVWIENTFASNDRTQQMQDTGEWHIDFGRISLPSNYDPDGEPVRLIIYSHGGSVRYNPVFENTKDIYYAGAGQWEKTIHIDPALFLAEGYAVMDMDACFCIFNTKDIDGVRVQGGKQVANCYKSAYDFVIRNYNIKTDGVLLGGISFGGNRSLQLIAWSNIPILAVALHSPYTSEHKYWFIGHRKTLARHAGFTDYDEVTTGNLDAEQLEIMEENYPKLLRTSPMLAMCHPSKEEFFATKTIDIEGQPVEVSLLNGYKNFGIYVVSTWAAHFPVSIKIWAGTADTTAQPDEHANILYSVGINGGSDIELRTVQGAKHISTVGRDIITIPIYVTKYGETLTNVSMIYAETIRYWRRYEQD